MKHGHFNIPSVYIRFVHRKSPINKNSAKILYLLMLFPLFSTVARSFSFTVASEIITGNKFLQRQRFRKPGEHYEFLLSTKLISTSILLIIRKKYNLTKERRQIGLFTVWFTQWFILRRVILWHILALSCESNCLPTFDFMRRTLELMANC